MATIRARRQANGTLRYTAMVRLRKGKTLIHQEAKTFSHRGAAASWAKVREVELQRPGALDQAQQGETSLAALIRWYIDSFFEIAVWRRAPAKLLPCKAFRLGGQKSPWLVSANDLAELIDRQRERAS